jgi:Na+/melibiose symporter-like transporter
MRGENRPARDDVLVLGTGFFVTALAWPALLGRLPFALYLKNQLHLPPERVALFWFVGTLAWYAKPVIGLLCDAYPLFGTRRHGYLVAGTVAAGLLWLGFGAAPPTYGALIALMVALIAALAFVSTALGGLLVESGQRRGATGRLSSLRQALVGIATLVAGPLGGWLAGRPLGATAVVGAAVMLAFLPVLARFHREPRDARPDAAIWARAGRQLRAVVSSRAILATAGLLFFVNVAPSLQTPLIYYQQDVLRFTPQVMGNLFVPGAAGALIGAAAYAVLCRLVPLRTSLYAGIVLNVGATLLYLGYRSPASAVAINATAGVLGTLAALPLYDLGARAVPKGSESLGFALLASVQTVAMYGADLLGSYLYGTLHLSWSRLVWANAGWVALALLYLPLLPRAVVAAREGR